MVADQLRALAGDVLAGGTRIGDLVVEDLRREGGFALLYAARDVNTNAQVALKVLRRELAFHGTAVARFHREIAALRELSHPVVVRILAKGDLADGRPWLAMEWLEGRDLAAHIRAAGALSLDACLSVALPLAHALDAAHALGLVHRDLKAENVMVHEEAGALAPTLVDFGIAHWSARDPGGHGLTSHSTVGSPCSMAPEQILGQPVDRRTDVYAFGVLLFQMATGRLPFRAADAIGLEEMHLHAEPPLVSAIAPLPAAYDAIVRRCMDKDPAKRPATAGEVAAALRALVAAARSTDGARESLRAALHVEVLIDPSLDDPGDDVLDDAAAILDAARDVAAGSGFAVAHEHATALLAITADARTAVARATALASALASRPTKHASVACAITVHAAPTDDELARTATWVNRAPGLVVTEAARAAGLG